jgi:hypothetical protein
MVSDRLMVDWEIAAGLTPYPDAVTFMEDRATAIAENKKSE